MPFTVPVIDTASIDPDSGMLCYCVYWRPRLTDSDPEMPGEKLSAISFIPTADTDLCLCGSGKTFQVCCKVKRYWEVICPNPDLRGYDLLASQTAIFTEVDGDNLGPKFMDDERLYCVENTRKRAFWTYWGDPSLLAPEGTLCFGDFELLNAKTLIVTAMSTKRMEILLALLTELAGDNLGSPQIEHDNVPHVKKPQHKKRKVSQHRH